MADLDKEFEQEIDLAEEFAKEEDLEKPKIPSSVEQILTQKAQESIVEPTKSLFQTGLETASDVGRSMVQGLTMGLSDEAIAALKASKDIALTDKTTQDWKDLFRRYQEEEQAKVKAAEERSPILTTVGEIAGGIIPSIATAGAALPLTGAKVAARTGTKELLKRTAKVGAGAAGAGAIYGAGKSEEGKLIGATPEEQEKLKADILGSALTGGIVGSSLSAVGQVAPKVVEKAKTNISEFIEKTPMLRRIRAGKEYGTGERLGKKIDVASEEAKIGTTTEEGFNVNTTNASRDLTNLMLQGEKKIGLKIGSILDDATNSGIKGNLNDELFSAAQWFKNRYEKDETIASNPLAKKLYDKIFQLKKEDVTPREMHSLKTIVEEYGDSIREKDPGLANEAFKFARGVNDSLKELLPEYKIASDRYAQFRSLLPEQITEKRLSNLKNYKKQIEDKTKKMISESFSPGEISKKSSEIYSNFVRGIKKFEDLEADRLAKGLIKEEDLVKLDEKVPLGQQAKSLAKAIRNKADESAMLDQVWNIRPISGEESLIKKGLRLAGINEKNAIWLANKYGLSQEALTKPIKTPIELNKKLMQASGAQLKAFGEKLSEVPGVAPLGKALVKGLENKDQAAINAIVFAIMQNPQARILLNAEDIQESSTTTEE